MKRIKREILLIMAVAFLPVSLLWADEDQTLVASNTETTVAPQSTPASTAAGPQESQKPMFNMEEVTIYGQHLGISHKELSKDQIQDIQDSGNLSPTLDSESGLEVQGEESGKMWSTLAIRGQSFRETTILIDGVRVPETFHLGDIPTESVDKVEILEGPQALSYGSDAMGGAINIVTKQGADDQFHLSASGGDFDTYQFRGVLSLFRHGKL